jgi:hypothetical protein
MKRSRCVLSAMAAVLTLGLFTAAPTSAASTLTFTTPPADALKTQPITGTPLDALDGTVDGPFVAVQGTPNSTVTLTSSPASFAPTTVATDGNGVATFTSISIATPGTYTLTATSPNKSPATSSPFRIFDAGDACGNSDPTCDPSTGTLANKGEITKVAGNPTTGGGVIAVALDIESAPVCNGDGPQYNHGPSVVSAFWENIDGDVIITQTISKEWDQLQSNNGASFYQVCFTYDIAGKTFTDKFGNQNVTTGLLPDCGPKQGSPCVKSRTKDKKGNVIIVIRVKEDAHCK